MYKSVNDTLSPAAISTTYQSTVSSLPSWALVGAELQNPKNGEIIAEFPGKGQNLSAKKCGGDCDDNTPCTPGNRSARRSSPTCCPPRSAGDERQDQHHGHEPLPVRCCRTERRRTRCRFPSVYATEPATATAARPSAYKVENDGGEQIGKQVGSSANGAATFADSVQDALAQSSNTGFTDLAHRVGTAELINMASSSG